MFIAASKFAANDAAKDKKDFCIIGAGAAGITLARALAQKGKSVYLLEAGGFDYSDHSQDIYEADISGLPYDPLNSRLRYFGGSTNHWSGWCREIDPVEFSDSETASARNWPISFSSLANYYLKAAEICDIHNERLTTPQWLGKLTTTDTSSLNIINGKHVDTGVWQYSTPTNFGIKFRKEIEDFDNITALLGANFVESVYAENKLKAILYRTFDGQTAQVEADRFILCSGGIENARLMLTALTSDKRTPGNKGNMVGKYFADHFIPYRIASVISTRGNFGFYSQHHKTQIKHTDQTALEIRGYFKVKPRALQTNNMRNIIARLDEPKTFGHSDLENEALYEHLAHYDFNKHQEMNKKLTVMPLVMLFDQHTPKESQLTITPESRDAIGLPKLDVNWQLDAKDRQNIESFCTLLGEDLAAQDLGRVQMHPFDTIEQLVRDNGWVGQHHIGTTRIATSEQDGVVDTNLKVFGVDNLYVSGSSVFPSVAAATPTLTIVALSLRLADHLGAHGA